MVFFVLGSHPELSVAEIEAVTGKAGVRVGDIFLMDNVDQPLSYLQSRLAGTIKIGRIVGSFDHYNKDEAAALVRAMITDTDGKVHFGISAYGKGIAHHTQPLGLTVKKLLKADGVSARLVTSKEPELSSVVVSKNKLLESGGEFVILEYRKEFLVGQTETVQDFEAWGDRDFGRPARDAKSGMLPPKLSRMMINLSGADPFKSVLLDPFCGSGTVLMEALVLGFKGVIGSDISEQAVKDSEKNIDWQFASGKANSERPIILKSPAETLKLDTHVDVVVTEPYLGPPQRGGENLNQLVLDLTSLYIKAFGNIGQHMKPGAKLVAAIPVFYGGKTITKPLPGFNRLKAYRYSRPSQRVERDITVFEKA